MESPNFSSPRATRTTAVFTKRPVAGQVKTRLCPPLAPEEASQLAEAMLRDLVERLSKSDQERAVLVYSPAEERAWFAANFPELRDQREQVGEGLGERMLHFFFVELAGTVSSSAVVIGSDAPLLRTELILDAHDRLQAGADLVLGPDEGGGYYLIGMKSAHRELFESVEMSTGDMCAQTVEVARELGLQVELLEPLYDLDLGSDLDKLRADLATMNTDSANYPARTAACLAQLFAEEM